MKLFVLFTISMFTLGTAFADEPKVRNPNCLTMPCELVSFANSLGMQPMSTDFYSMSDGSAIVGPPFVYGIFYPFEMAAFWATKRSGKSSDTYLVVLKRKFGSIHKWKLCNECSAPIVANGETIGGLWFDAETSSPVSQTGKSIFFNAGKPIAALSVYRASDKTKTYVKKQNIKLMVPPIVSMEDGLVSTFYCIDGEWWVANTD